MKIFGNNGSNFRLIVKFEGELKFYQILNQKIVSHQISPMWIPFLYKFITLKELTTEGLINTSWNKLENIKRPRESDFPHLKHLWI